MDEHPPIPGYELIKLLGRDGHLIYSARRSATGQLVWLNVVQNIGELGQLVADRLRQQAQVLATLNHPNIVRVVEIGQAQGIGFFSALEFAEGSSLDILVRGLQLPQECEVVRIAKLVAAALDYSHGRNIVHGYVHPKHIMLDQTGQVFLFGFGEIGPECREWMVLGDPHFQAPEQIDGLGKTVPQTDVYGLAEVVFLLLTGFFPFGGEGIPELFRRKRSRQSPSIRKHRPELPRKVDLTLQRAMALRPEDRYRSPGKFVEELELALRVCQEGRKKWWQFWR